MFVGYPVLLGALFCAPQLVHVVNNINTIWRHDISTNTNLAKCCEPILLQHIDFLPKAYINFSKSNLFFAIVRTDKAGTNCLNIALPSKPFEKGMMDISSNPGPDNKHDARRVRASNANRKQRRHLQIAHLNVISIKNRQHYIFVKELALKNEYDILTISESWLNNTVQGIEVEIPRNSPVFAPL
ncbi:Hypothetical predicted protein [Paramuricea clavata]|uniref:Uncharacterized protein n=1 Tax=Paramuricea clavata TaxID=317549 RepID=A0A7D9E997_PARCT|nr:Hypothetical predicted protein [Paramuricea clavata]